MSIHLEKFTRPDLPVGRTPRRGSITVLCAVMFSTLLVIAGLTINLTQLATVKTEMRLSADAASKAGAIVLGQTQNIELAREAAKRTAASHLVNGRSMLLHNIDVDFGFSQKNSANGYDFLNNVEPFNSVRVRTRLDDDARSGVGTFFMAGVLNPDTFVLNYQSVASRVDHDLCLVVDRSGSMAWTMTDEAWDYPDPDASHANGGNSNNGNGNANGHNNGNSHANQTNADLNATKSIIQHYFELPDPDDSRWAALTRSTDIFFEHLDSLPVDVQSGLVSYSSNFIFGLYSSQASTVHSPLTDDYESLQEMMHEIGQKPLIGNTNIASGMQSAVGVLTGDESRLTAKGTMVVLTDGIGNQGTDPVAVATAAAAANITVHTITFSDDADQVAMQAVAAAGGGNHYHAPNEASLRDIFAEIAETLPAVLMQ